MDPADRPVLREPPPDALRSFLTPTSQHFVLAALGIPRPRPGEWSVRVGGAVARRQVLSSRGAAGAAVTHADRHARMRRRSLRARQAEAAREHGEVARRAAEQVLALAEPLADATHVWIDGADWGVYLPGTKNAERVNEYRKDLPLERARRGDVLLAYEMNDEPLPPEHGYPLRVIVPGFYGTNSVKWVNNLIVAHGRPYALFSATLYNTAETVNGAVERRQVAEMHVNSLLTSLRNGDVIPAGTHRLSGWAWAPTRSYACSCASTRSRGSMLRSVREPIRHGRLLSSHGLFHAAADISSRFAQQTASETLSPKKYTSIKSRRSKSMSCNGVEIYAPAFTRRRKRTVYIFAVHQSGSGRNPR